MTLSFVPPVLAAAIAAFSMSPAAADQVDELFEALALPEFIEVMVEEGVTYGDQIAADMLTETQVDDWQNVVTLIYDADWMARTVIAGLRVELEGADVDAMLAFFGTEPGASIVPLELAARRALLEEAVNEAAKEAAADASGSDRMALVRAYMDANDLVESNVVGALNANYAFYVGLVEGGAFDFELTDEQILTEVWAQEADIRSNTVEWAESFLFMAYAPLQDAELEAYIAFSNSPAGEDMNAALFAAFDTVFVEISRALGLGAARFMVGEDL